MLEVKVLLEFFDLIDIMKKQKSITNIPFIKYWSKFRRAFFEAKNFVYTKKILVKVGLSRESIATPSCCL